MVFVMVSRSFRPCLRNWPQGQTLIGTSERDVHRSPAQSSNMPNKPFHNVSGCAHRDDAMAQCRMDRIGFQPVSGTTVPHPRNIREAPWSSLNKRRTTNHDAIGRRDSQNRSVRTGNDQSLRIRPQRRKKASPLSSST
jgi:hypothetical protein